MTELDPIPNDPSQIKTWIDIFRFAWDLLKGTLGKSGRSVSEHIKLQQASEEYRKKILELYGTTRILGKNKPVPLENIYTDLYLWDKPLATRRFSVDTLEEAHEQGRSHERFVRHDGLDVVEKYECLFILGKPGAGKTTFLKWVATQVAQDQDWMPYLPIFISLKELADSKHALIQQLVNELEICQFKENTEIFLVKMLETGKVLVLLDGLDEVQAEKGNQEHVIDDIRVFVKKYNKSRYLITSRVAAVNFVFDTFTYVEMSDFNDEQIDEYIERYFLEDEKIGNSCKELLRQPTQQKLRDLGRSPILLSLLCLNYEETRTLPSRRVEFYEEALDAFLKKWDSTRNIRRDEAYKEMSLAHKKHLYARLAYHNFVKGTYFISSKQLEIQVENHVSAILGVTIAEVEGDRFLKTMEAQHGILVEQASQAYAFLHITFQEYFTAKYIVENVETGTLDELLQHIDDFRWREVFLLTASLMKNSNLLFEKFLHTLDQLITTSPDINRILRVAQQRQHYHSYEPIVSRGFTIGNIIMAKVIDLCNQSAHDDNLQPSGAFLYLLRHMERFSERGYGNPLTYRDLSFTLIKNLNLSNPTRFALVQGLGALGYLWSITMKEMEDDYPPELQVESSFIYLKLDDSTWREKLLTNLIENTETLRYPELASELVSLRDRLTESNVGNAEFKVKINELSHRYLSLPLGNSVDIHNPKILCSYLHGSALLCECITLATKTDQENIKARLLLAPAE